jgi:uncharacterized protein (DUF169 family)
MPIQDQRVRTQTLLSLEQAPLAITFSAQAPAGVPAYEGVMPTPMPDGRTGKVPAGCVFWIKGADRTFTTRPEDHGNCSVGSMTHGLKTMAEVAGNTDVAALLASGWVTLDMVPHIPVITQRPNFITYGPLQDTPVEPDVVLLRLNPKQVMVLHDAIPEMRMEGKPQCHIIAIAKNTTNNCQCRLYAESGTDRFTEQSDDLRYPGASVGRGGHETALHVSGG